MTYILGISAFYHDSAACLVRDGEILAAAQEERFTRKKHDQSFPEKAIKFCLDYAGISISDVSHVTFYEKPRRKFERILNTFLDYAPRGWNAFEQAIPSWFSEKLHVERVISEELGFEGEVLFTDHHLSHAYSAFYPSPFKEAAILTLDGVGEWSTTLIADGNGARVEKVSEIGFPHSLGLLYSAFTTYTGFKVNSGEYKMMGLAPYGEPKYKHLIYDHLVDVKPDGSFRLNMEYFPFPYSSVMTNDAFHKLFGGPPRKGETTISQKEMDIARSIQDVTEEIILKIAGHAQALTGRKNLCLAGGVALNCVANGKLLRKKIYDDIWIQPAAGDAGGALGAAVGAWYSILGNPRNPDAVGDRMQGAFLGTGYSDDEIGTFLDSRGAPYRAVSEEDLYPEIANLISNENVIGWFQGRMEFGPRALGARSILGDPRSPDTQEKMNLKIKFRESFRPFAPSVLREDVAEWFELDGDSPYMLLVAPVKGDKRKERALGADSVFGIEKLKLERSVIPAITHVDYSARVQTVDKKDNPRYHKLISEFKRQTGCPLVVNTSFNVRGEPPVNSPEDAYICFMRTNMDYLVMGNIVLDKKQQPPMHELGDWQEEFELD